MTKTHKELYQKDDLRVVPGKVYCGAKETVMLAMRSVVQSSLEIVYRDAYGSVPKLHSHLPRSFGRGLIEATMSFQRAFTLWFFVLQPNVLPGEALVVEAVVVI